MTLQEAIAAIRALEDLPQPRRIELIRRLVNATTTGAWALIVAQANHEARLVLTSQGQAFDAAYADRLAEARRRAAVASSEEPQEPVYAPPRPVDRFPEPRPITTSWMTPKNPNGTRPEPKRSASVAISKTTAPDNDQDDAPKSFKHGVWGYEGHRCRCDICVAASKAKAARRTQSRREARLQSKS